MLLSLPTETIHHIASLLNNPSDLITLSATCRRLSKIVRNASDFLRLLRRQGWDTQAIVRRAPHVLRSAPEGAPLCMAFAQSAFHKFAVISRVLPPDLPTHFAVSSKRKISQKAGEKLVRHLAEIASENEDSKNLENFWYLTDLAALLSLSDPLAAYLQSFTISVQIYWCISTHPKHLLPLLPASTCDNIDLLLERLPTYNVFDPYRKHSKEDTPKSLTLITYANLIFSKLMIGQTLMSTKMLLPSTRLTSTLFDSSILEGTIAWQKSILERWKGPIRAYAFYTFDYDDFQGSYVEYTEPIQLVLEIGADGELEGYGAGMEEDDPPFSVFGRIYEGRFELRLDFLEEGASAEFFGVVLPFGVVGQWDSEGSLSGDFYLWIADDQVEKGCNPTS
jgi:hypothetical protein